MMPTKALTGTLTKSCYYYYYYNLLPLRVVSCCEQESKTVFKFYFKKCCFDPCFDFQKG